MTPKDKAEVLFKKYYSYLKANLMNDKEAWEDAKQCALIAVDEILNGSRLFYIEDYKYWKEVKQEIENL